MRSDTSRLLRARSRCWYASGRCFTPWPRWLSPSDVQEVWEMQCFPKIVQKSLSHCRFCCKTVEQQVSQEEMAKMGKLVEEGLKAGYLLGTEGCLPSALGARVRRTGEKVVVMDGPFIESKEVVGGF